MTSRYGESTYSRTLRSAGHTLLMRETMFYRLRHLILLLAIQTKRVSRRKTRGAQSPSPKSFNTP